MGGNPDKNPPFFFTKPPDAAFDVSLSGPGTTSTVHYPPETEDLQHEVEMVVAIGIGEARTALLHCCCDGKHFGAHLEAHLVFL